MYEIIKQAEQWLEINQVKVAEQWLVMQDAFEMQCPYIYPPMSRYRDFHQHEVYSPSVDWKNQSPALYVHIPYCIERCNFCNFALDVLRDKSASVDAYLNALDEEISQIIERTDYSQVQVSSIYIGGGTPSVLNVKQLKDLFELLDRYFILEEGGELSFEVNPDTVQGASADKLYYLKEVGVTRVSLGVQNMENELLKSLKRLHTTEMIQYAIDSVRKTGIEHLNIDLMYCLPELTAERWTKTLERSIRLNPDSITTYELRISPHSSLNETASKVNKNRNLQRAITHHMLSDAGYFRSSPNQYIADWWHAQKHYIDIRERLVDVIALGVSAISSIGPTTFRSPMTLAGYMEQISNGNLTYRGISMTLSEECTRAVVLGLKSPHGVSLSSYENRFGISLFDVFSDIIGQLSERGILVVDQTHMRTTDLGSFFMDQIATLFFQSEDVVAVKTHEIEHLGVFWH